LIKRRRKMTKYKVTEAGKAVTFGKIANKIAELVCSTAVMSFAEFVAKCRMKEYSTISDVTLGTAWNEVVAKNETWARFAAKQGWLESEKKHYLHLKNSDRAIGEGEISLVIVDEERVEVSQSHIAVLAQDGVLHICSSVQRIPGLSLDSNRRIDVFSDR